MNRATASRIFRVAPPDLVCESLLDLGFLGSGRRRRLQGLSPSGPGFIAGGGAFKFAPQVLEFGLSSGRGPLRIASDRRLGLGSLAGAARLADEVLRLWHIGL